SDHAPTHAAPLTLVSTQAPAAHAAAEAQHATSQVSQTAVSASNVRSFEDASARGASRAQVEAPRARSSTNWWLRVAAALLLTATAGMTASLVWKSEQHGDARLASADQGRDAGSEQSSAVVTAESRPAVAPASSPAVLSNAADVSGAATSYRNAAMPDATAGEDDPRADDEATPFAEPRRLPAPTRTAHARTRGANRLSRSALGALVANSRSDTGAETEITTDYFPLSDASALPAMEGGHVVRVELPRAALLSFGLPVNAEQTSGRVKADVLIGHDGLARAIRFVH
ncbi:MAG TPA: hypothetical protein VGV38_18540, partial [Pyrinomonadaceae bacterium]|nr:hypothetical protein [Pyrinomonadaceae bacterium]